MQNSKYVNKLAHTLYDELKCANMTNQNHITEHSINVP